MTSRILSLVAVAGALIALAGLRLRAADDKVQEAHIVKVGESKITLHFKGADKPHTHDVAKDAKITLDGKDAKLEDLKEDFSVKVTMDDRYVITKIEAKSKDE
jgi:hypothetical protein